MIDFLASPLDTDLAYSWVKAVFPSDESQPYGQAFAVFTSSLTFIAALFMGWHIMVGIVTSAYSGKVLGERYHQIWAPLRVVLGFGLLVPLGSGFSTVHYILRDVIGVAAVQMANIPITTYIDGMARRPTSLPSASLQGKNVAEQVLMMQACAANVIGINTVVGVYVWPATGEILPPSQAVTKVQQVTNPLNVDEAAHGAFNGFKWSYGDCGSLILEDPEIDGEFADTAGEKLKIFAEERRAATQELMNALAGDGKNGIINYEEFGKFFATKDFDETMSATHVKELRDQGVISADFLQRLDAAAAKWDQQVGAAAAAVFADSNDSMRDNLLARIKKYGFMAAGSYERTLSQLAGLATSVSGGGASAAIGSPGYRYDDAYKGGQAAIRAARQLATRENGLASTAAPSDGSDAMDFLMNAIRPMLIPMKVTPSEPGPVNGDPVGDMIAFGHKLVTGAQAGIIAVALAHGAGEGTTHSLLGLVGGGVFGGIVSYLSQWVGYAIMIALVVGMMHAYVLPMIPMIMVFVMGVTWLVLFLEAAIAGVLWAFAFVRMDGQEFFDRNQAPGVTLLFNLFLRPAIGMLAFIGGLILMPHLLNGLELIWDDSFSVQTSGLTSNFLVGWAAGLVIKCWMQWHLYLRIWGLVPSIADRVGHWMGFQMHGYNDGEETRGATGAMVAAGGAMAKAPIMPSKDGAGKGAASAVKSVASSAASRNLAGGSGKTRRPPTRRR